MSPREVIFSSNFQRFHDEALKTIKAKLANGEQPPTARLDLPNGEAVSDSGR
jgi:hypothetical protein